MTAGPATPTVLIVDGLEARDVVHPTAADADLSALQQEHLRHFPDHPHTVDEFAVAARAPGSPAVVVHQWLLLREGRPAGEFIFHTNTARGVMIRHFLAVDADARLGLAPDWLRALSTAVEQAGQADMQGHGGDLLAMISEIKARHAPGWRTLGYRTLDIGYQEPLHGKHWPDFGEPRFMPMIPCLKVTAAGEALPLGQVAQQAVAAFLVDFYGLPPTHPVVVDILQRAGELS